MSYSEKRVIAGKALLVNGMNQRLVARLTGIDRKTIRKVHRLMIQRRTA